MIYAWRCTVCGQRTEIERRVVDCTVPPPDEVCPPWDSGDTSRDFPQEAHAPQWQRIYEAPMQTKESYPDGYKRKGWKELREAARLEKVAAVTKDSGTKAEIRREIVRMGVKPSKSTNI